MTRRQPAARPGAAHSWQSQRFRSSRSVASLAGCGGSSDSSTSSGGSSSSGGGGSTQLTLVAYSTPKKAYDALTTAFAQTSAGKGVTFSQVVRRLRLAEPGGRFRPARGCRRVLDDAGHDPAGQGRDRLHDWNANPQKGFSSDSVVVFVVRKGNPKHITGWDDLIKPGVKVITPNPSTSGSARWNILAGYGAQLKEGKTPAQALAYVNTLLTKNVRVQQSSASAALQTFTGGKGDVLLDYESDAMAAQKAGDAVQIVYPQADDPDPDPDRGHGQELAQDARRRRS